MEFAQFGQTYVLRLDPGEEVMATLLDFAGREKIGGGYFVAFGAFSRVRLCYFDVAAGQYLAHDVGQQVEVVSLLGNLACADHRPVIHMHAAVSDAQSRTYSGHLDEGIVQPTLEVFLTMVGGEIRRTRDPATGLELLALPHAFRRARGRPAA